MLVIPPAKDTDVEDVVWGLQTADTLWKRGERIDALVWLRRAAQAAGDANDDDRALELARLAAELTDFVAAQPPEDRPSKTSQAPVAAPSIPVSVDVDLTGSDVVLPVPLWDEKPSAPAVSPPHFPEPARPEPPAVRLPSQPTVETPRPAFAADADDAGTVTRTSVPPASAVHAGMFDPWAEQAAKAPPAAPPARAASAAPKAPTRPPVPSVQPIASIPQPPESGDDEVVTSLRSDALAARQGVEAPKAAALAAEKLPLPRPPPLPPRAKPPKPPPPRAPVRGHPPSSGAVAAAAPVAVAPVAVESAPEVASPPAPPPSAPLPEAPKTEPADPHATTAEAALDLESVDAFADLPDDARDAFALAASIHRLAEGEEIGGFALAYIVAGTFDVAATVVDAAAARLPTGTVLRARGTTDEGVPMRLISAVGSGVVATWTGADVEAAFRTCPWVEEDLRTAADRMQALVGITIGPLGERLDASIREEIVGRLTMRPLEPGEIVVEAGSPVPGLFLVGVGELELARDDGGTTLIGSGEFLFPGEVLNAGAAPATARAGAGGAVVLFGDRAICQELLVTCPPLLEVFAGM